MMVVNSSDTGRQSADTGGMVEDAPSHRQSCLVVEVYYPPPLPRPSPRASRVRRREGTSPFKAGVAVLILHAAVGTWLWMNTSGRPQPPAVPMTPLDLLPLRTVAPAVPDRPVLADIPPPEMTLVVPAPTMPRVAALAPEPPEVALSLSLSADVLITDANSADVEHIVAGCGLQKPHRSTAHLMADPVTLLVRVEKDGRVSDSKVEVGSGKQGLDAAAQRCMLTHGLFQPRRLNGETVLSWQRVRLPVAQTALGTPSGRSAPPSPANSI